METLKKLIKLRDLLNDYDLENLGEYENLNIDQQDKIFSKFRDFKTSI